jgi:hypothetical protein
VYQLYFDNVQLAHFGIIRQQIWTFLHFPFHLALVLFMEGTNQFISWRHVLEYIDNTFNPVFVATSDNLVDALNQTISTVLNNPSLPITQDVFESISAEFKTLSNPDTESSEAETAFSNISAALFKIIFDGYGFEPPEEVPESEGIVGVSEAYYGIFTLVFGYFFISAGVVLIFLGILSWLSHSKGRHEARSHLLAIASKFLLGLGLVLCSTMVLTDAADGLGSSAWTLPLMFFVLALALLLNYVPLGKVRQPLKEY